MSLILQSVLVATRVPDYKKCKLYALQLTKTTQELIFTLLAKPSFKLSECSGFIHNLEITGKDTVDYSRRLPQEERDRAIIQALEVGVFCLERTQK
ncbi:MAG: hypothetical protein HWQ38_12090 [Nostoc sp. NMS7]|uniref:hypothetical protein n=1 Tax=Nostoc sp. NMS7 TaxID=2815391 RepID=UPI0025F81B2D|nr:hypothetical protein [Nostoc sp. NMS7]MBN3947169.1 hypothetical protein [Nostoc sp. NMS7]